MILFPSAVLSHRPRHSRRAGVLLLVVLSMLTLFMLLGVTYLIMAARVRSTSKAYLKLADDQAQTAVTLTPLLKDAALQVMRGTGNSRSTIRGHDLLADKYGSSATLSVGSPTLIAGGQLLRLQLATTAGSSLTGRVLTYLSGPDGVTNTSSRIVAAEAVEGVTTVYLARPTRLAAGTNVNLITRVLVNGRDFAGSGFSTKPSAEGFGNTSLDNSAFEPNLAVGGSLNTANANEDYDALDEQNWALAVGDGSVRSFERKNVLELLLREYGRTRNTATRNAAMSALRTLAATAPTNSDLLPFRKASLRPFAFDHWQDAPGGTDFTGKSLDSFDVIVAASGDVDNDGDGTLDSLWLDLGNAALLMPDRKYVKPLFAIHCVDLGGRVNLNAHGSPTQSAETSVVGRTEFAPKRNDNGAKTTPTWLRGGLGYGSADVRLDAVLTKANVAAVMLGSDSASGIGDGIRRDLGGIVGRYGDGVSDAATLARPGTPNSNDRRQGDSSLWTDRGLPVDYWSKPGTANGSPSSFGGRPPDMWSRLSVGLDHRGHPFYAPRSNVSVLDTTDNPYELDLFRPKPGNGYAQAASSSMASVDQPFTAAELEGILRAFDFDNAAALPPRGLALTLSAASGALTKNRMHVTTESWDTPAVISTDLLFDSTQHDPDLVAGLKMDINRPFGDARDNDNNGLVDEPREAGDSYRSSGAGFAPPKPGWYLTRFQTVPVAQPGSEEPHLRARQLFAWHVYNLLETLRQTFAAQESLDPGLRLFAIKSDRDDATTSVPQPVDPALLDTSDAVAIQRQVAHTQKVLAQWAVNVVDFLDADAIMTPFRYTAAFGNLGNAGVVWGCEKPDLLVTETLAFHDRRTADTKCDPSQKTTVEFKQAYKTKYDAWEAAAKAGPEPNPVSPDDTPDKEDMDFDQVRIPEGSLFLELYSLRDPNTPNLPRELYSYDATSKIWSLDLARVPSGGNEPVWRLSVSKNHATTPHNDVFQMITANSTPGYTGNPDTEWLSPGNGTNPDKVADVISIDRYVWFSNDPTNLPDSGTGPTKNNTFFVQDPALPVPKLPLGGYLVVGPRRETAIGSVQGGKGSQKWGAPAKQRIVLKTGAGSAGNPAVGVYDLTGSPNPTVAVPSNPAAPFGNRLPPPDNRLETSSTWVAMARPSAWDSDWNPNWKGNGTTGIGLNVSEPLRSSYYPCPTTLNAETELYDAYGPLDNDTHASFPTTPVDRLGGSPIASKMLSGGTFANFCTVFVERLADPTRPHQPNATSTDWNPYIVVDFMPIDLTVFNGESDKLDPRETQGPDRKPDPTTTLPSSPPPNPIDPQWVPLPFADTSTLAARHTYFHSRQRGFGKDLSNYDNDATLFGLGGGQIFRNPHPFKPIGSLDDLANTPLATAATTDILPGGKPTTPRDASGLSADQKPYFLHELGQSPAGRSVASAWRKVPYHSLGWVNPSFGRRLDTSDGVPAAYAGCPDRPFPWLVWNDGPFANPYELLFVPRTPPGRLLTNFRNLDYPSDASYQNVSHDTASPPKNVAYNQDDIFGASTPGSHLLPITAITDVPATGATRSRNADLFVRLFEYVRVRSPFTATETVLTGLGNDDRPDRFAGPFNRLPKYREPGRININTIHPDVNEGKVVWNALCGRETTDPETPSYADIDAARAIPLPFSDLTTGDATYRRPWRTASGTRTDFGPPGFSNALVPAGWLSQPQIKGDPLWFLGTAATAAGPSDIGDRFSARSFTLLGDKPRTGTDVSRRDPLFAAPAADAWANDGKRDAWFRFESLVRANANATVRSEVYAIWVTMGLFEVTSANVVDYRYPDGYRLVREYGSDTGDVTRHRAFYIFDRSIPVGFEQGQDHNVQDAILTERFIE